MDERELDELIQNGFRQGVAAHRPTERWNQIASELARPRRRGRPGWLVMAASLAVAALLSSLLFSPLRALATEGLVSLFRNIWEGRLGETPAAVFTLPEPVSPATLGPKAEPPTPVQHRLGSLTEAAAVAGFTPPTVAHDQAMAQGFRVDVFAFAPAGETRVVEIEYRWGDQAFLLSALASFAPDETGVLRPAPLPELLSFSPTGEAIQGFEKVDLGGAEALCMNRDFGSGKPIAHCQWLMDGMIVHLTGEDQQKVIELARTVVKP